MDELFPPSSPLFFFRKHSLSRCRLPVYLFFRFLLFFILFFLLRSENFCPPDLPTLSAKYFLRHPIFTIRGLRFAPSQFSQTPKHVRFAARRMTAWNSASQGQVWSREGQTVMGGRGERGGREGPHREGSYAALTRSHQSWHLSLALSLIWNPRAASPNLSFPICKMSLSNLRKHLIFSQIVIESHPCSLPKEEKSQYA